MLAECGLDEAELEHWLDAARRVRNTTDDASARPPSPYPGLASFDVAEAAVFFGRRAETAEIVERVIALRRNPGPSLGVLAVVGPSGSGKSSLLRAGVVADLRQMGIPCVLATPTTLATATVPDDAVLVLDQFEETLTSLDEPARADCLRTIAERATTSVVIGLRVDFYPSAAAEPGLVGALRHAQLLLEPLSPESLRDAIVRPADAVGLDVEDGFADRLLADLAPRDAVRDAHDVGSLPLLSHVLRAAWEHGAGRTLGSADYRAAGGLGGAVQHSAEVAYQSLDDGGREAARSLFLRLVNVEGDVAATRRRLPATELWALYDTTPDLRALVDDFVARRLLTVTADSVMLTHEALLSAWPRLRDWIDGDRAGQRLRRTVTRSANLWQESDRDPALLLRGVLLESAVELASDPTLRTDLNRLENDYVHAGVVARDAARDRARRGHRRLRRLLAAVVVLFLVAAGLAALSFTARLQADRAEHRARTSRDEALSRQIAGRARELLDSDPALAQQLALVAYREAPSDDARGALIDQSSRPAITRVLGAQGPTPVAVSPDGRIIAVGHADDGSVHLLDATTAVPAPIGLVRSVETSASRQIFGLAFSQDGRLLATGGQSRSIRLWDVSRPRAPRLVATVTPGFADDVQNVAFSPARNLLVAAGSGPQPIRVWDVSDPDAVRPVALPDPPPGTVTVSRVRFAPDGSTLAAAARDGHLYTWRISNTQLGDPGDARVSASSLYGLCWLPDGRLLAGDEGGRIIPVDARTLRPAAAVTVSTGQVGLLVPAPGGHGVLVGSSDNTVSEWSSTVWSKLSSLGNPGPITGLAYGADGATVISGAADGTLRSYPARAGLPAADSVYNIGFSRDGDRFAVATGGSRAGLQVWDTHDPDHPVPASALITMPEGVAPNGGTGAISADGNMVVGGNETGQIVLFDVRDPARPQVVGRPVQALDQGSLVQAAAFAPDGTWLATGGDDSSVHVLDLRDPARPRQVSRLDTGGIVLNIAVSADGRLLAAASADGYGYVWRVDDPARPRLLGRLGGFDSYAYAVTISPDSSRIAVGSADHTVRMWHMSHGRPKPDGPRLIGPSDYVFSVAFSPDGKHLAVGSSDHTARIYGVLPAARAVPSATLDSLAENVFAVAYTRDGDHLYGAGRASFVATWDIDIAGYRARLCRVAGDPITRKEWALYVPGTPYDPPCR